MNIRWAGATAADSAATKWGRSSPTRWFSDVHEPHADLIEIVWAERDTPDGRVNVRVNARVNSTCCAAFTSSSSQRLTQPGLKQNGRERPQKLFGRLEAEKVGSLPPILDVFPPVLFEVELSIDFSF